MISSKIEFIITLQILILIISVSSNIGTYAFVYQSKVKTYLHTHARHQLLLTSSKTPKIDQLGCYFQTSSSLSLRSSGLSSPSNKIRRKYETNLPAVASSQTSFSTAIAAAAATRGIGSFFLVRILFLRGLAFVYGIAFLVAYRQNKALIGDNGITPARDVLNDAEERGRLKRQRRQDWIESKKMYKNEGMIVTSPGTAGVEGWFNSAEQIWKNTKVRRKIVDMLDHSTTYQNLREKLWDRSDRMNRPLVTLFWLASKESRENNMNKWLDGVALGGLTLSTFVFVIGAANVPILFALWMCQRSLMSVGGPWYGYGWEPQLAELTFHSLFLAPLLSLNPIPSLTPVPVVTIWAMRWFLFRIMMGAGLIKLRSGDNKWKLNKLSTMDYFYETQPVPNPLTRYFHRMPKAWHKFEVLTNHFVELIAPWLLILPGLSRKWRITGGMIQLIFQAVLISSGNLSFLNWLTMLPALFCLDDAFVSKLFVPGYTISASIAAYTHLNCAILGLKQLPRSFVNVCFGALIMKLSIPVVNNLLSKKQKMNASFDPLRLVNTYGAFGTVEEERIELVVESSEDYSGPWREYQFKVKPGDVERSPRWISPYHHRIDWQMWIASLTGSIESNPWMFSFLLKLLQEDPDVLRLLEGNPWESTSAKSGFAQEHISTAVNAKVPGKPKYIRIEKYHYKFNKNFRDKDYWVRRRIGRYFPKQGVCTEEMLVDIVNG